MNMLLPTGLAIIVLLMGCSDDADGSRNPNGVANFIERHQLRLNTGTGHDCGPATTELTSDILDIVSGFPEDSPDSLQYLTFDFCNATRLREGGFEVSETPDTLNGGLIFYSKNVEERHYWIFIFANARNITNDVFGTRNLVKVPADSFLKLPITVERAGSESFVLSVMLVEANPVFSSQSLGGTSALSSTVISLVGGEITAVSIPGEGGEIDPYPEYLSFSLNPEEAGGGVTLVFSHFENDPQDLSFVPLNIDTGSVVALSCGSSGGEIVTVTPATGESTAVVCMFPEDARFEDYVFVIAPNFYEKFTERQYNGLFYGTFRPMVVIRTPE